MAWETPEEEIERLETERHRYSLTFANTSPTDTTTRAHLQHEMDWRTQRIRELQDRQPMSCLTRLVLWATAAAAAWGAWAVDPTWAKILLGIVAAACAFVTL